MTYKDTHTHKNTLSLMSSTLSQLIFQQIPPIHFLPCENYRTPSGFYSCPCYKTTTRAGTLSTTGFHFIFFCGFFFNFWEEILLE